MQAANLPAGVRRFSESRHFRFAGILFLLIFSLGFTYPKTFPIHDPITITGQKPLGPVPGTFTTDGAFFESGAMVTLSRSVSALPSPFGVITHLVLRFEGQEGTFTIRTQIRETVTSNPNIFLNQGVWVIVDGTGAYSRIHGTGSIEGVVNEETNLITRVFTGSVHIN